MVHSLTTGNGSVQITIPETFLDFHRNYTFNLPTYGDIVFTMQSLKVSGLDNFTELSLFRPVGENMLSTAISSNAGFNVSIVMDIEVKPANGGVFRGDPLNETFELKFNASDVNFTSQSAVDFDSEMFSKLTVGSFIYGSYTVFENNRNIFNCVLETLSSVVIANMQARMNLDAIHVTPVISASQSFDNASLEVDIDSLINNVLQMILLEYPATTTESLVVLIQNPVRDRINKFVANLLGDTKKRPLHCVNVEIPNKPSERPLQFNNNKAIIFFDDLVNRESSITTVNSFIECVNNVVSSKNLFSGHFYNVTLGEMNFGLHDLKYENVNSVHELGKLPTSGTNELPITIFAVRLTLINFL